MGTRGGNEKSPLQGIEGETVRPVDKLARFASIQKSTRGRRGGVPEKCRRVEGRKRFGGGVDVQKSLGEVSSREIFF